MPTPTRPSQEAPPRAARAGADPSTADWQQRFPAPMSHAGHEVTDVNALFDERMTVGRAPPTRWPAAWGAGAS